MIKLYGMGSPNVVKVVIALEELRIPFDFEMIDVINGDQFSDAFGALTPNRKVPVILDDEGPRSFGGQPFTLWESGAILLYLAERSGQLLSPDPATRYITLQWLMFQMGSIGPMSGQLSHFRIYAPQPDHAYARARYATEVKRIYDVVETRLQKSEYLAGRDYSIADIAAWPWLKACDMRGVDIATLPCVQRWIEAIAARPAVQQALTFFGSLDNTAMIKTMREGGERLDRYLGRGRWSRPDLAGNAHG
jgi:GSH-dependent disulfide-bond oxidoreductase